MVVGFSKYLVSPHGCINVKVFSRYLSVAMSFARMNMRPNNCRLIAA